MATFSGTLLLVSVALSLYLTPTLQAGCHQAVSQTDYPNCRQMDGKYALHWSLSNDSVTFAIQVDQTSGWFALGLSEGGGMRGADVWLFTQSGGTWSMRDYWSVDYVTPEEDSLQDGELLSVQQSNGSTVAVFRRQLDTCDLQQDQKMHPSHKQPYIWAYGQQGFGYHGTQDRGTLFIALNSTKSGTIVSNDDPDTRELAFTMDDYIVPAQVTSYTCINFEAPTNDTYHLTSTNYTITPNKMVHHMLFMACDRLPENPLLQPYDCPSLPAECSNLWLVWVPGQEPEEMPANTGYRFGRNSSRYMMVQIHYTNPDLTPNVKDSSGFVVRYTPNLRQYDLGVMWLGTENFEIPPGEEMAGIPPSVCPSECTSRFSSPLNLVASEFHMHQLGARQTAQHLVQRLADGRWEETEPLNYRDHYDFDWQGGTFILPGSETLAPGSALITTCWWNTKGQKNTTYFGLSSFEEMCYNFLRYWPAQKIDRCMQVLGTENNGTALAQCNNQGEFLTYVDQQNYTDFNETVVMDLIQKGFLVQFNTTPYKDFKPFNRTTPTCAATLAARQSGASPAPPTAQPAPPAPPAPAAGDRSAAAGAAAGPPALLAMAALGALLSVLMGAS